MSYVVVVLLSLLWLGFFLPGLLQARRSSPLASASTFQDSLTRISTGHAVDAEQSAGAPGRRSRRELARQRDVLAVLSAVALGSVVVAFAFGGWTRWLAVPAVLAFFGYVAALRVQTVNARAARRRPAARPAEPITPPVVRPEPLGDGVVPSVRRRVAAQDLERIAG